MLYKGALTERGCYSPRMLAAAPKRIGFFFFFFKENRGSRVAWWESAFELSAASAVSDQSHQHLVWTRGKEWFSCLLGMPEGPDNYIWQSQEEWLCNAIAKNYPFNSISGCLGFSNGMTLLFCRGLPFCWAASQLVLFVLALTWRGLFFLLFSSFPALFLQPLCLYPQRSHSSLF